MRCVWYIIIRNSLLCWLSYSLLSRVRRSVIFFPFSVLTLTICFVALCELFLLNSKNASIQTQKHHTKQCLGNGDDIDKMWYIRITYAEMFRKWIFFSLYCIFFRIARIFQCVSIACAASSGVFRDENGKMTVKYLFYYSRISPVQCSQIHIAPLLCEHFFLAPNLDNDTWYSFATKY